MNQNLVTPMEGSCRAEYESGFIYDETQMNDISPFVKGKNTFDDILHGRLEEAHGKMVKFTVFYNGFRTDYDWTNVPEGARPVRFRHMEADTDLGGTVTEVRLSGVEAGYQFTDNDGKNKKVIEKL